MVFIVSNYARSTVSVIVGFSLSPIPIDLLGVARLTSSLSKVEESVDYYYWVLLLSLVVVVVNIWGNELVEDKEDGEHFISLLPPALLELVGGNSHGALIHWTGLPTLLPPPFP